MLAVAFAAWVTSLVVGETTQGGGQGFYINILDLDWWQALIAILGVLGMSPAPWIAALAAGRLLFRTDMEARLAERDKAHEKVLSEKESAYNALLAAERQRYSDLEQSNIRNVEAAKQERERADRATAMLGNVAEALEANSHIMSALRDLGEADK